MKRVGYFDVSMFWLVVLLVVVNSMHNSRAIVFENKGVLMEHITSDDAVYGSVSGAGRGGEVQSDVGVRAVLTSDELSENRSVNCCTTGVPCMYRVTEPGTVLIVY